jgi:two-component system cell cycle sensor histidine kinase/response regulator CckA
MNVRSEVGESGARYLSLLGLRGPDSDDPPIDGRTPGRQPRQPTRGQILVVEDDRSIRDVLRGILEDEGYSVAMAADGRQALERLRSSAAPDVIVLDLRMPVMDGWQFRAAQKTDPAVAGIPVLAISADGSAKAAAIDAAAYLRKPLSSDALLGAISRIMVEVERERLLGKLEEAERFAALGRLAASVGHEINNPLAYVSMNVDLATSQVTRLLEGNDRTLEDVADLPTLLTECRIGLDRIRDIVKDLQRLSRRSELNREAFSLNGLVDESLTMARNHVEHRAAVHKSYGDLPIIVGDRSALGQVVLNLILNAAQALPAGRADANALTITTSADRGTVTVEIADTGAGIPAHVLPHIFDPFFTTKEVGEGTGLGLAVSCRIVADHGGRIDVDSQVGRGSSFRVVLPVAGPLFPASPSDTTPRRDLAPIRGRILVIDDVPDIGRTIAAALREHDVTVVQEAEEAFALFASNEMFDVILCDLMMPEMGGRDVVERLKVEWPGLAERVVFMTGGAFTAESRDFLKRSPYRVLTKPFSIDDLRAEIRLQLQNRVRERN